ncbi:ANT(4')-I family aminoglycoside nucleotidyltransferase [Gorillibacterium sp. CAU 1737]|uniref:ANT(4')-I family aminoglycoside nucleotidyltransferase n=1 Tax=Gorillibacterium sp. CAU 1737 TaxID=3140362 RepID=UPI003260C552
MTTLGPVERTPEERRQTCTVLAQRLQNRFGDRLVAIGVYGSIARGTDGPYSDIEMMAVVHELSSTDVSCYEWSSGPWKAEVDICEANELLQEAATVEGRWPLTHGSMHVVWPLYDPSGYFARLKEAVESPSDEAFHGAINEVLVGEMYEFIGKLRNVERNGPVTYLPYLAMQMANYGAMLLGLHHRRLFTTGALVLPEACAFPDQPDGFKELAALAMNGELSDAKRIAVACERFWNGLVQWAASRGYRIGSEAIPF